MEKKTPQFHFNALGTVSSPLVHPYDAPRQGPLTETEASITLYSGANYEQALEDLAGFDRIWIIGVFHRNTGWKPKTTPPAGDGRRVGVFASRSPYRPNPLALSCVQLLNIRGRTLFIRNCDLLDGTPVLDIKPYLPYADAFPEASAGWTAFRTETPLWKIEFSDRAAAETAWLEGQGIPALGEFICRELSANPLTGSGKRLLPADGGTVLLCYRTWRIRFKCHGGERLVVVLSLESGYDTWELAPEAPDPYLDKALHRRFNTEFRRE